MSLQPQRSFSEMIADYENSQYKFGASRLMAAMAKQLDIIRELLEKKCPSTEEKCLTTSEDFQNEKYSSTKEILKSRGYITLTEFGHMTIHPIRGAFLSAGKVGRYLREYKDLFKDCFYQRSEHSEFYVHPQELLKLLAAYGSVEVREFAREYLIYQQEKNKCYTPEAQMPLLTE
jgi:hypothetical protein